jgi:riboflavin biosynthesis pyrimidine reductase
VLNDDAPTMIVTTAAADPTKKRALERLHIAIREVSRAERGVCLASALSVLRAEGVGSLLVEGGASVITSLLGDGLVDRLILGIAPKILGNGTEGVADLGIDRVSDGIRLGRHSIHTLGDDLLMAWDIVTSDDEAAAARQAETAARR